MRETNHVARADQDQTLTRAIDISDQEERDREHDRKDQQQHFLSLRLTQAVAEQEKSFTDLLAKRGLSLRTDLLKPLVNWLSPDFAHRRFNTRYFAATVPVNQQPSLLASKGVWGRWVCVRKVVSERDSTVLGDEVGQENTVGRTLGELLVPGSEIMLEKMAKANGCIAYLSYKRKAHVYQPKLVEEDGRLMLEVEAAKTIAGEPQRER